MSQMKNIVFKANLFAQESDRVLSQKILLILLEALVRSNIEYLKKHPSTLKIYKSGVVYRREDGTEEWKAIPELLLDGYGDCEDLGAWLCAERRMQGYRSKCILSYKIYGSMYQYHVKVYTDGIGVEDPSRVLGMGKD